MYGCWTMEIWKERWVDVQAAIFGTIKDSRRDKKSERDSNDEIYE
jgi:hypothetical protein